jgi:hypothetical protein
LNLLIFPIQLFANHPGLKLKLLGGLSESSWNPIRQFCERNKIPCLFPNTNLPEESTSGYTFYFHGGVLEEARMAASALTEHNLNKPTQ